jgi:hypothetical protein
MSVQDDKAADQDTDLPSDEDQHITEKPEPDEDDKRKAAEMMTAYEDRPTLVLPGTGGMVSGTAVNDWLDDEGNPKYNEEAADDVGSDDNESDKKAKKEQIEKDKAWNEELKKAAAQENKGEDH